MDPFRHARPDRNSLILCLLATAALSIGFESLFVRHGLNPLDEGWPLYAVQQLREGGQLYQDVLWVFPPGHLLPAWIGASLAPPGIVATRVVYAAFAVAASLGVVLLGARLMSARWVLLAGLLTAVAAPDTHQIQAIFGYRYIVFSMLALLCLERRAATKSGAWLVAAGALLGVGACFRLAPAFAGGCGIGIAIATLDRSPRRWLIDWGWLALGLLATLGVAVAWLSIDLGIDTLWREMVVRPATMLADQSLPWPAASLPDEWDRKLVSKWFIALLFRWPWLLFAGLVFWLGREWLRSRSAAADFEHPLLLAVVVWGGVFYVRSLTRSDAAHLESVIPPIILLLAYAVGAGARALSAHAPTARARAIELGVFGGVFAVWVGLSAPDVMLIEKRRGVHPLAATGGAIRVAALHQASLVDSTVAAMRKTPRDTPILDVTASPILFVLADRRGYGELDLIMPGTFLDEAEETRFVQKLEASPPPLVIWPLLPFDLDPQRFPHAYAPQIDRFVADHYARDGRPRRWLWLRPSDSAEERERTRASSERARQKFMGMTLDEMRDAGHRLD
jgi:hypothetical protein